MNWLKILTQCGVKASTASQWAEAFGCTDLPGADDGLDEFLGQILHESMLLERLEENLTYTSASRLCAVWPSRFKSPEDAAPCVRNPQALANRVYSGRLGNISIGDGWRYRGRGLIMVTGRANYSATGKACGLDLVANPDQLAEPVPALRASVAWWLGNVPGAITLDAAIDQETRIVNGGTTGMPDRIRLTGLARQALGVR